jgi:hypothetical protein
MSQVPREATSPPSITTPMSDAVLSALTEALRGIRYGTVTIIIQDGRIVQIDRTERRRLTTTSADV